MPHDPQDSVVSPAPSRRWYEGLRADVPGYNDRLNAWKTLIQHGAPGVLGTARDILASTEYMPWYASPVHQDAQFFLMAHLAGSPDPAVWTTLWQELMAEHADCPKDQRQAWESVRPTLMLHALGPGHPGTLLSFLAWNERLPHPHAWSANERRQWVWALLDSGRSAMVVSAPPAHDPERNAGAKLLALLDAHHLEWSDVTEGCSTPGLSVSNHLWKTPGTALALERGLRDGHLEFSENDVAHLWASNDLALWDLAERVGPDVLDRGMAIVQNYPWWGDPSLSDLGERNVSRAAWLRIEQKRLRALMPGDLPSRPGPRL